MQTIQWGIIGCGDVCEVKSGPAFNKIPHSRLVAVMRRNEEKVRDYAKRHEVPKWYTDAGRLIADPEVNAVYVATPPDSHALYAIQAMKAGKPVYVEKPMSIHFSGCEEMITVSEETGVALFVAYYRRGLPAFRQVKTWIEEGAIGEVRMAEIRLLQPHRESDWTEEKSWRVDPAQAGGGYFADLASHQLDLMDYFLGPIETVNGQASNLEGLYSAEDHVSACWKFESGAVGAGLWAFGSPAGLRDDSIRITGTEGCIYFPCFSAGNFVLESKQGKTIFQPEYPVHIQQPFIESVVAELRGEGYCYGTAYSAARTNSIIDRILADYYGND